MSSLKSNEEINSAYFIDFKKISCCYVTGKQGVEFSRILLQYCYSTLHLVEVFGAHNWSSGADKVRKHPGSKL